MAVLSFAQNDLVMRISLHTTIDDLVNVGALPKRVLPSFAVADVQTLGELIQQYPDQKRLLGLPGMGKRSCKQVLQLLATVSKYSPTAIVAPKVTELRMGSRCKQLLSNGYHTLMGGSDEVSAFLRRRFPSADSLLRAVMKSCDVLLPLDLQLSKEQNIEARNRLMNYLRGIDQLRPVGIYETRIKKVYLWRMEQMARHPFVLSRLEIVMHYLSPAKTKLFLLVYSQLVQVSPRHIQKLLQVELDCSSLISRVESPLSAISSIYQVKSSSKVAKEIFALHQQLKEAFDWVYLLDDSSALDELIRRRYSFLETDELNFVQGFYHAYKRLPQITLLLRYLQTTHVSEERAFALRQGIVDGVCYEPEDIMRQMGTIRKQVVALLSSKLSVLQKLDFSENSWNPYKQLLEFNFLLEDSPIWNRFIKRERFPGNMAMFCGLLSLWGDYAYFSVRGRGLIVNRTRLPHADVLAWLIWIEGLPKQVLKQDTVFSIKDWLTGLKGKEFHTCLRLLRELVVNVYGLPLQPDDTLVFQRNCKDYRDEIREILMTAGQPLSLSELSGKLSDRFPGVDFKGQELADWANSCSEVVRLRSGLIAWESLPLVRCTTIRQLVQKLLGSSDQPMSLKELIHTVQLYFPNTSKHSLGSSLLSDSAGRFINLGLGYYTVSRLDIATCGTGSFTGWLDSLQKYVQQHQHWPMYLGVGWSSDLQRLYEWTMAVQNGCITLSESEQEAWDNFVEVCSRSHIPTRADEYVFLDRCKRCKAYVKQYGSLPLSRLDNELFQFCYRLFHRKGEKLPFIDWASADLFDFFRRAGVMP